MMLLLFIMQTKRQEEKELQDLEEKVAQNLKPKLMQKKKFLLFEYNKLSTEPLKVIECSSSISLLIVRNHG